MLPQRWLWAFAVAVALAGPANAAELVMFYRDGCPYCAAWEREIGPIYHKTEIARRAPLRRVNLDRETLLNVDTGLRYSLMLRAADHSFGVLRASMRTA